MKIRPSSQRLLVKLQKPAEKSSGGSGEMLDDGTRLAPVAEVGDVVVVYRGSGHEVAVDGKEYRIVHESEVLGVETRSSEMKAIYRFPPQTHGSI